MGIWGTGNFERDDALNVLDRWVESIRNEIKETFSQKHDTSLYEDFGESRIIGNIDILGTLLEQYQTYPYIELEEIVEWRNQYLETFDRTIHVYNPTPEYEEARRKVIQETFDRFYEIVDRVLGD